MPRTVLFAILTTLISVLPVAGADEGKVSPEEATTLRESSSVAWPIPPFSRVGITQCDADGNLYFRTAPSLTDTGVLKVAHDGSQQHFYKLPSGDSDSKSYAFDEFNVTPSGDVRMLAYGADLSVYIFKFDPDFSVASKTKLQLPEHMHPDWFAAFESGALFLSGHFDKLAEKETQGKRYTAIFEASGKLRAVVEAKFASVDLSSRKKMQGGTALGADGFLYLLGPDDIAVISESDTVVRQLRFKKPNADLIADRIVVSEGLAVVELEKDEGIGKAFEVQYLVLNASTGERVGLYQPDPAWGNDFLCFSRTTGFAFGTVSDEKMKVLIAPLR